MWQRLVGLRLTVCDTGEVQGPLVVGFQKNANKIQPSLYSFFCLMSCVWGIFADTHRLYIEEHLDICMFSFCSIVHFVTVYSKCI